MADPLWTLGEVVSATGGRCEGDPAAPITGLSIDSRAIAPGEGFVAIRGPNRDGHDFVPMALDAGAGCAVVEETFPADSEIEARAADAPSDFDETRLVRVHDTFDALNDLGRAGRDRTDHAVVIAVTGSAGKTGT